MSDNIQHAPACKSFSAAGYYLDLMCTPYFVVKVGGRRLSISAKHKPTPHMYAVIFPWLGHRISYLQSPPGHLAPYKCRTRTTLPAMTTPDPQHQLAMPPFNKTTIMRKRYPTKKNGKKRNSKKPHTGRLRRHAPLETATLHPILTGVECGSANQLVNPWEFSCTL